MGFRGKFSSIKYHVWAAGMKGLMILARLRPLDRNKVMAEGYYGGGFGDNGKAVAEALLAKRPGLDVVWAAKPEHRATVPAGIRYVQYRSPRYFWELATAAVWIDNSRKRHLEVAKRRGQFYIQCWHGGFPLKKIERDVEEHLSASYVADAKWDAGATDLMLSGNEYFTGLCRSSFWYDGEVLTCGTPRLDALFHVTEDRVRAVRERLGVPEGRRLVLYAPTFRVDYRTDCYSLDFHRVLERLERDTGEKWMFLVRLHPNVADRAGAIEYTDDVRDATAYPDLYELLPAVDMVISDYSSLMLDAGLIKKPTFIFATDLADYLDDRGIYLGVQALPFPLAESNDALLENLRHFDRTAYEAALEGFFKRVGSYENGTASEKAADRVLAVLDGKQ